MSEFDDEIAALWSELHELQARLTPPDPEAQLRVPDIVEFVTSPEFLGLDLQYPDQMLVLKVHWGQIDLLTDDDRAVLEVWARGFAQARVDPTNPTPRYEGENGIVPDVLDRVAAIASFDRKWFRQAVWPWGRRAGKTHLAAICVLYLLWHVMALGDPRRIFPIRKGKVITAAVFASSRETALTGIWWDVVQIAANAPCFAPWIVDLTQKGLLIATPADVARGDATARGTLEVKAFPSNRVAGRGRAMIVQVFDEMAFVTKADSSAPAEEVFNAVTPGLDQFRGWSMILAISSPWQRTGKFFELAQEALEIDAGTGTAAYPETYVCQFNSWQLYDSWPDAHHKPMVPETIARERPFHRGSDGKAKRYPKLPGPIQAFDRELEHERRKDPVLFAVEREARWADVANPAFDRDDIAALWIDPRGEPVDRLQSVPLRYKAVLHIDPAFRHDNTAWAIGYSYRVNESSLWRLRVAHTAHLRPRDYSDHRVDLDDLMTRLIDDINGFGVQVVTVDQHNGELICQLLKKAVRDRTIRHHVQIDVLDQTQALNAEVLDSFREALTNRLIDCPYDHQLDQELRFATVANGRVEAPTSGPITTDDLLDALMILNHQARSGSHIHEQLSAFGLHATRKATHLPAVHQALREATAAMARRGAAHQGHNPARPWRRLR